ncbi:MAG: S-methyl-5-thioribose-1-phosphate isomerase [Vampirovibrionales bacterium]
MFAFESSETGSSRPPVERLLTQLPDPMLMQTPELLLQRGIIMPISFELGSSERHTTTHITLLDQRTLPQQVSWVHCESIQQLIDAIQNMVTRGAPLLGLTGAYGVVLSLATQKHILDIELLRKSVRSDTERLKQSRPTAVNLSWGVDFVMKAIAHMWREPGTTPNQLFREALRVAHFLHQDDLNRSSAIRHHAKAIMPSESPAGVLTICNTGALATGGGGTALGVIAQWASDHLGLHTYACETRPRLQGAKLTAWELEQLKVPYRTLITEGMSAALMASHKVHAVVAGADRIAKNGDSANKIGTYTLAILAKYFGIPFYIAAPLSTVDWQLETGDSIVIEEREDTEVKYIDGQLITLPRFPVWNPAFDVTPASLITGIITEVGVIHPTRLKDLMQQGGQQGKNLSTP